MLNSEPVFFGKVEYIEDVELYKLYQYGLITFFSINENNEFITCNFDSCPQETYIVEDNSEITVYTLPDNSKLTYDFGPAYSYSYDDETKILTVCYDLTTGEAESVKLNDDGTATIYIGENVTEYGYTTWCDNFKTYVGEFNGRMYMKIYEVNDDGTLTYYRHFEVVYNAEKNRYETTDGCEWYTINDDGTLTWGGMVSQA